MTWPQMQEMVRSGLIEIQPHSKTHANLTVKLPGETDAKYAERIRREVDAPVAAIKERLALASFSYRLPLRRRERHWSPICWRARACASASRSPPGATASSPIRYMLRRTMIFGTEDLDALQGEARDVRADRRPDERRSGCSGRAAVRRPRPAGGVRGDAARAGAGAGVVRAVAAGRAGSPRRSPSTAARRAAQAVGRPRGGRDAVADPHAARAGRRDRSGASSPRRARAIAAARRRISPPATRR